jgi:hypothetical protein
LAKCAVPGCCAQHIGPITAPFGHIALKAEEIKKLIVPQGESKVCIKHSNALLDVIYRSPEQFCLTFNLLLSLISQATAKT